MFRSSFVIFLILITLLISFTNGKDILNRKRQISSTHKPVSFKICGSALVRILDTVCQKANELLMNKQESLSHEKRQLIIDDDPFTRTISIKDYARRVVRFF